MWTHRTGPAQALGRTGKQAAVQPCARPARHTSVQVAAKQALPAAEGMEQRGQRLTPRPLPVQQQQQQAPQQQQQRSALVVQDGNTTMSAVGSSIKYQIKPGKVTPQGAPSNPLSDFVGKLKLAWNIFFPEQPVAVSPKEEGKQRLRMILVADRCGMSPAGLSEMKKTILRALEEYVDIESEQQIDVSISMEPQLGTVYCVAVPIKRVKPGARMALENGGEEFEGMAFEWDPEDWNSDPSERFPYGC